MAEEEVRQTTIPVPDGDDTHRLCQYCGDLAVDELTLEKERKRTLNGKTKLIKRAITIWVCQRHKDILMRNNPAIELTKTKGEDITSEGYVVMGTRTKRRPNWMDWF